jgi:hypothetical protein
MNPKSEIVREASNTSRSTLQRWEKSGDAMNIPIQMARRELQIPHRNSLPVSEQNSDFQEERVGNASIRERIDSVWQYLFEVQTSKRPKVEIQKRHDLQNENVDDMMTRAQYLRSLKFARGGQRHRMETWVPDARNPLDERVLSCPRKPVHANRKINSALLNSVMRYAAADSQLCAQAISIYMHRVQDDGFVRFDNLQDAPAAKAYFEFLTAIGILKKNIILVSGDRAERSPYRAQWTKLLHLNPRSQIDRPSSKVNFGPKSALSIRPIFVDANGNTDGDCGLRFLLMMLFILFGEIPSQ